MTTKQREPVEQSERLVPYQVSCGGVLITEAWVTEEELRRIEERRLLRADEQWRRIEQRELTNAAWRSKSSVI